MADDWESAHSNGLRALRAGRSTEAVTQLERAVAAAEKFGTADHRVASCLHSLERAYRASGRYDDALSAGRRALWIREQVLGGNDPDIARSAQNLGIVHALRGEFPEADRYFSRALGILERALGDDHPDTLTARRNYERMLSEWEGPPPTGAMVPVPTPVEASTPLPPPPPFRVAPASLPRVLLVDDDEATRYAISRVLTDRDYEVIEADTGRTALEYLSSHAAPDLILTDMLMPDMNGWEFRVELLKSPLLKSVPVVVLSGVANVKEHADLLKADAYLVKPIDYRALVETVGALVPRLEDDDF